MLPLPPFPFPLLSLVPVPPLPLPVAPLPLPELPPDTWLVDPDAVATDVVFEDVVAVLAGGAPPLSMAAVTVELLAVAVVALAFVSLQTVWVPILAVLRTRPDATAPWAIPCVTLWTFSLTSPSELEMRKTPALGP